tara:strand:+ start:2092 stop:2358 length:267 start_codon:yes stop_codon:yes gene_type:complete
MADGRIPTRERLSCACGNQTFDQPVYITMHPTQGASTEPAARVCRKCKREVNVAQLENIRLEREKVADAKKVLESAGESYTPPEKKTG